MVLVLKRGTVILEAWEKRRIAELEAVHVTNHCLWCAWTHSGTVVEAREAHRAHRIAAHPDRKVTERRKRHRPHRQFNSQTDVDTNIQNARAQGAATWAGPAE